MEKRVATTLIILVSIVIIGGIALNSTQQNITGYVAKEDCPVGMMAYWNLNEGTGTVAGDFLEKYDASTINMAWGAGKPGLGKCLKAESDTSNVILYTWPQLQGPEYPDTNGVKIKDMVDVSSTDYFPQDYGTVEFWVYSGNFSKNTISLFDQWDTSRNHIFIRTRGDLVGSNLQIAFEDKSSQGYAAQFLVNLAGNEWHHVVVMWDTVVGAGGVLATNAVAYIDGERVNSKELPEAWKPDEQRLVFGKYQSPEVSYIKMDEIAIYKTKLNPDIIKDHYNNGLGKDYCAVGEPVEPPVEEGCALLSDGETGTVEIGGNTYSVDIAFVSSTEVKLNVNGEITPTLSEGETSKLSDGSTVVIKLISSSSIEGELSKVDFCITSSGVGETCTDSDADYGPNAIYIKGTTVGKLSPEHPTATDWVDICVPDGTKVLEYSCDSNNLVVNNPSLCPNGCEDGACLLSGGESLGCAPLQTGGNKIPPRTRVSVSGKLNYCDPVSLVFEEVKALGETCNADYECNSNVCIDGECTSIKAELREQKSLLGQIWCAISRPIDFLKRHNEGESGVNNNYLECIAPSDKTCQELCASLSRMNPTCRTWDPSSSEVLDCAHFGQGDSGEAKDCFSFETDMLTRCCCVPMPSSN